MVQIDAFVFRCVKTIPFYCSLRPPAFTRDAVVMVVVVVLKVERRDACVWKNHLGSLYLVQFHHIPAEDVGQFVPSVRQVLLHIYTTINIVEKDLCPDLWNLPLCYSFNRFITIEICIMPWIVSFPDTRGSCEPLSVGTIKVTFTGSEECVRCQKFIRCVYKAFRRQGQFFSPNPSVLSIFRQ